jgi:hypothetical protein
LKPPCSNNQQVGDTQPSFKYFIIFYSSGQVEPETEASNEAKEKGLGNKQNKNNNSILEWTKEIF